MKKLSFLLFTLLLIPGVRSQNPVPSSVLTPEEKVFGLAQVWSEVNYNFIFRYKMDSREWDSTFLALIPMVQQTSNDYEYFRLLERFSALMNDGHSCVGYKSQSGEQKDRVFFPVIRSIFQDSEIWLGIIEGKPVVESVNSEKQYEIPVGSEVVEVNGLPVDRYIDEYVAPYINESSPQARRAMCVYTLFEGLVGSEYEVVFRRPDGSMHTEHLRISYGEEREYVNLISFEESDNLLDFKWFDGEIAYVALNGFANKRIIDDFLAILPELRKAEGLIVDIRGNGGGSTNTGAEILKYITTGDELIGSVSYTRQNLPTYKAYGGNIEPADTVGAPQKRMSYLAARNELTYKLGRIVFENDIPAVERIIVPTVILTGLHTASAAEDFLILADGQEHMTRMGEATWGSTGQPVFFELPRGLWLQVCSKNDTYPDGREFIGYGVIPEIEVHNSLKDLLNGRDNMLETAIEYLK